MPKDEDNQDDTGGLFKVHVSHKTDVAADRADFRVTITGSSLVAGTQALQKAREVAQLVQALTENGVPEADIFLEDVTANIAGGTLLKSSQATYRLRVHCAKLEMLADILGILTSQKNAALQSLQWGYPDAEAAQDEGLRLCIARANKKAALIAEGLGVKLLGIRSFTERVTQPRKPAARAAPAGHDARLLRRAPPSDLGGTGPGRVPHQDSGSAGGRGVPGLRVRGVDFYAAHCECSRCSVRHLAEPPDLRNSERSRGCGV